MYSKVKFCTGFDIQRGVVPATAIILDSKEPNYGVPSDYELLDTVYIESTENIVILGTVIAKHYPNQDDVCFIELNLSLLNDGIPDYDALQSYFQDLSILLGQESLI